ncbi:PucR family transcriptional regulator, partial [Frankia sp. CiP1_Cm_nod2]|uniref:PucR family transcriptional regulator n=2 Tax=unclassified Frankia TaxID=2632575 RepID=UPI002024DD64
MTRPLPDADATPSPAADPAVEDVIRRIERSSGMLASRAVARMHEVLPWFTPMSARHRADIQLVVQAGISSFVEWCRSPQHARELSGDVFRVAPRDLVRAVTFRRLVELVRVAVEAIEAEVPALAGPEHEQRLLADVLRYSRDIAFAGAVVYARAAEERGAWDARLEALVVDHVVRGEVERALPSRAAALGWRNPPSVAVIVGDTPDRSPEVVVDQVHRLGRGAGLEVLTGVHHERLVVIVGGDFVTAAAAARRPARPGAAGCGRALLDAVDALLPAYGPGPVIIGPVAADLATAASSAHAALAAADVVAAW